MLSGSGLVLRAGGREILSGASLEIRPGEVTSIIGPNGAGKSTLLRAMAGLVRPSEGEVRLGSDPIAALSARDKARRVSFVAQDTGAGADLAVRDLVLLGRYAHRPRLARRGRADAEVAEEALGRVGMADAADRQVATLSGGERQLVQIARAIAQRAGAVLLDEPTSALDVHHRLRVLGILRELAAGGAAVAVVLHDLNEASRHGDRLAAVSGGRVVATGRPGEVLTERLLADVYRVEARVRPGDDGRPQIHPIRIHDPLAARTPSPASSAPTV